MVLAKSRADEDLQIGPGRYDAFRDCVYKAWRDEREFRQAHDVALGESLSAKRSQQANGRGRNRAAGLAERIDSVAIARACVLANARQSREYAHNQLLAGVLSNAPASSRSSRCEKR